MPEKQLQAFRYIPGRPPERADVTDYVNGLDVLLEARQSSILDRIFGRL